MTLPICAAVLAQETGATELERQGCPQGLISAILGHSSGNVTRLYIHNDEEMMREYLDKVCEAVTCAAKEEAS